MAEKVSPGQRDSAAAQQRTAAVGAENKQDEQARQREARAAERRQQERASESPEDAQERRNETRRDLDKADSAADKFRRAQDADDTDLAGEVALNPYPAYEDKSTDGLRSLAESRDVEIGRDVEKAELVKALRAKAPANAAGLDFMTVEELRALASEKGVELDDEFVRGQLVTELRAADTHTR